MLWLAFKLFWSAVMCRQSVDFRPLFDKNCKLSVSPLYYLQLIIFAMSMQHLTFVLLPTVFRLKMVRQL